MPTPNNILHFWFSEKSRKYWFNQSDIFDEEINNRFSQHLLEANDRKYDHWKNQAQSALALVILLDQFSRNIYRLSPKAYNGDEYARQIALYVIDKQLDTELSKEEKSFLYMPFMHSESLSDQELSVKLFKEAELKHSIPYAIEHHDIIKRFGRFPHRNAILGRHSTQAELDYLNSPDAFKG